MGLEEICSGCLTGIDHDGDGNCAVCAHWSPEALQDHRVKVLWARLTVATMLIEEVVSLHRACDNFFKAITEGRRDRAQKMMGAAQILMRKQRARLLDLGILEDEDAKKRDLSSVGDIVAKRSGLKAVLDEVEPGDREDSLKGGEE